jgi:hypothetical protein
LLYKTKTLSAGAEAGDVGAEWDEQFLGDESTSESYNERVKGDERGVPRTFAVLNRCIGGLKRVF